MSPLFYTAHKVILLCVLYEKQLIKKLHVSVQPRREEKKRGVEYMTTILGATGSIKTRRGSRNAVAVSQIKSTVRQIKAELQKLAAKDRMIAAGSPEEIMEHVQKIENLLGYL